jgi:hypothetical protein
MRNMIFLFGVSTWSLIALAQTGTTRTCTNWFEPHTYQDAIVAEINPTYNRPATIFGTIKNVPTMRIRFVEGVSGKPLVNMDITITYGWRWLEYPYPEHAWGAWSSTGDRLSCKLDNEGWIATPDHQVKPRGWYDGKYSHWPWKHLPEFTGVDVVATTNRGFPRVGIKIDDLRRFEYSYLEIQVFDGWRAESKWVTKH